MNVVSITGGHVEGPASQHISGNRCMRTHLRFVVVHSPSGCVKWHAANRWWQCC